MRMAPVRLLTLEVFGATLQVTVPLPVPVAPAVMVIQGTLAVAVQAKSVALDVTVMDLAVAPVAGAVSEAGERLMAPVTPGCVMTNVWPPMVRAPVRLLMLVALEATL